MCQFFFPTGVRGDKDGESFLNDKQEADITKLKEVLDLCPAIEDLSELAKNGDHELKQRMAEIHPLLHGLLTWIITSNRAHLRQLSQGERIQDLILSFSLHYAHQHLIVRLNFKT